MSAEIERRLEAARVSDPNQQREADLRHRLIRVRKGIDRLVTAYQEELITIEELRDRAPELRRQEQALHRELQSAVDQAKDRETYLRLAETLTGFLARLRSSAETLDIAERQRIVRLLVKEILVTEDKIIIRHSIPISGSPGSGPDTSKPGNDHTEDESYLLRSGVLSPLLSNLMLDVLDKELEKRGHRFVRYADDCNIYVRSRRAGERVMASVTHFLARRLKLTVNADKSAVDHPAARAFLGFSFTSGQTPKRRIAPQALARLKERVREMTRRTKSVSLGCLVAELSRYLVGWRDYFGFCETPSVLRRLDRWVRRRLRAIVWRQWKRGRTRFAALRRLGVNRHLAAKTAGSAHGPWRLSNSPALSYALPNAFFTRLGLASLANHAAA